MEVPVVLWALVLHWQLIIRNWVILFFFFFYPYVGGGQKQLVPEASVVNGWIAVFIRSGAFD